MNLRYVVLAAVCVAYLTPSASGFSLLAAGAAAKLGLIKGAVLGAGLAGLSRPASETVIINANGEPNQVVEVESSPVQVVNYQPINSIALPQPQGIIPGLWSVIQNAIINKTRAIGSLFNAFAPSAPQQLIIVVNNTDTTTTTTTTTQKPVVFEIVGVASPKQEQIVPVLINSPCREYLTC